MTTSNRAGRFSLALLFEPPAPAPEAKPAWRVIQGGREAQAPIVQTKPAGRKVPQVREAA